MDEPKSDLEQLEEIHRLLIDPAQRSENQDAELDIQRKALRLRTEF